MKSFSKAGPGCDFSVKSLRIKEKKNDKKLYYITVLGLYYQCYNVIEPTLHRNDGLLVS